MDFVRLNIWLRSLTRAVSLLLLCIYTPSITCVLQWISVALLIYLIYELYQSNVNGIGGNNQLDVRTDDVVMITGCDRGLGQAAAHQLSARFTVLATVLDLDNPAVVALQMIENVEVIQMNLREEASVEACVALVDTFLNAHPGRRLHGIINNAGTSILGELAWFTNDKLNDVLTVNLTAPVKLTKKLLPRIIKDKARIVNVTGINGTIPATGMAAFCAAKFGLEGFTDALRLELARHDVKVITVRPGDFSGLVPYVKDEQTQHAIEMWNAIPPADRPRHADRFDAFMKILAINRGLFTSTNLRGIQAVFEDTMTNRDPQSEYTEGQVLFVFVSSLLSLMPKRISGKIANYLIELYYRRLLFIR